jgi:choline dehydrogenase-like flavoprotein
MIYVIGSGPAGVASAFALVTKGYRVTMLDAGVELEADRAQMLRQLEDQDAASWDAGAIARLKENMQSGTGGVPLKYTYGSDFPYRETDLFIPRDVKRVGLVPSLALGGLSNVWGAAMLPYLPEDIADWPISSAELAPHYRSVLNFVRLAAVEDDLAVRFPLYTESFHELPHSRQIEQFLSDLRLHREQLRARGFLFGYSRLAVLPQNKFARPCAACGLCTYGCPYGLIYNTSSTLEELKARPNFTYRPNVVVQKFSEAGEHVTITAVSRSNSEKLLFEAGRVYVAAGLVSTAKLMLDSMQAYNHTLTLKDSQYFLLPLLRYKGVAEVDSERLHTLSQAFVEVLDKRVSEKSVHLQIYSHNDLHRQAIEGIFGPAKRLMGPATNALLQRLLLIFGYLHSDISPAISLTLKPPANGQTGRLLMEGRENPLTKITLRRLVAKLSRSRSLLRAIPLFPMLKVGQPGGGFHAGGSFPMRARPGDFESDVLGRPVGFRRIHLVDASVFPSIPASTITLSIMANAHRIASACDEPIN